MVKLVKTELEGMNMDFLRRTGWSCIFWLVFFYNGFAQEERVVPPGILINHISRDAGRYVGSPSIAILPDGSYVASHDEFGPQSSEFRSAQTYIFRSVDRGQTWKRIAQIDGQFWSNLFVHNGKLHLMGTNKHHGNLIIRRSEDGGFTWTVPYLSTNGLLLEGEYHTAPMPMIVLQGRIWRAVEYATAPTSEWGKRYSAMVISAPADADLLDASNWTRTNVLRYDSTYLEGKFRAWLEGNVVVNPQGTLLDILRVDVPAGTEEYVAVAKVSADGKSISFDPATGFIPFPGGSKKFTIRYDPQSKRYWTLSNVVPPQFRNRNPAGVRNHLALCSSADLKNWTVRQTILSHPDVEKHGFQYVDWLFDGNDIVFVSRTAYDDASGGANNNHDANYLTFHRISDFRE